ncbi:MAG: hypothetical protein H0X66_05680 [Verrucomicrobia bacterium]|nr:hypothetical protein [Verrucomicrobiota bacterium]
MLAKDKSEKTQYILVNRKPNSAWNLNDPSSIQREDFEEVKRELPEIPGAKVRPGIGCIFPYFRHDEETLQKSLRQFLKIAAETDTPVLVQIDGENWWTGRPDLWNWWDPKKPGYDPANRENVEWFGWSSDQALKIAWRNWGKQHRIGPPPNLMSPRYRKESHKQMEILIPIILQWWKALPAEKKDLLVGIKVGWESSIGVNAWYFPDGNDLLDKPASEDPAYRLKTDELPGRGVAATGYAAVKTAGIRTKGDLTEADLAEVTRRHLEDLSRVASELGVPRGKLFTHGVGWKDGELLYEAAVNRYSSPGWSFYKHARDPKQDMGVQNALKKSNAPHWAAIEWLFQGPREVDSWRRALETTLSDENCRLICIFNWEGIRDSEPVLEAIRQTIAGSVESGKTDKR